MTKHLTQSTIRLEGAELPFLQLHEPTSKEAMLTSNDLDHETKDKLQMKAAPFLALMRKYRFTFNHEGEPSEEPPIISKFRTTKNQTKAAWVDLLSLFCNPHNYILIFKDMPTPQLVLFREVLRNHYVISTDVNRIMGTTCFKESLWSYSRSRLCAPLNIYFDDSNHKSTVDKAGYYRNRDSFIYYNWSCHQELFQKFFPDLVTIKGCDNLPGDTDLKCYNGENLILTKLPLLASLYDSKQLPHTLGKQTASVVKKAQKTLVLPDFFSTYPDSKQAQLSTSLLVNYYIFFRLDMGKKKLPNEPEQILKLLFSETFLSKPYNEFTLSVLLPYLKGIKRNKLEPYNFHYVINSLLALLRKHHDKHWLPIDHLIMSLRASSDIDEHHFMLISTFYIDDMDLRNGFIEGKEEKCYIHPGNLVRQLCEPFIKALLCVLSTLGIAELAYREPQDGDTSPYDGLQYVRLTELGKYALGLTDSYEPQIASDQSPAFELDDQRLLIKILHDSPFKQILADYADSITPTLYKVSYESFLRNCSTRFDVEHKVKMFGQYIGQKQPQLWKDFLEDVVKRCNPFSMPKDDYVILTLPKDNIELQRLVLGNPSVRRYVLKAEGYMLLVKQADLDNLSKAMKKFGYLI